ncbi:MAG: beta-propeller fold lactonase family protein [Deltaproteobacteria bacterium]|nr:beta-propeller fold lactonase family protein [Deltaproteobacteria bacterium]
MRLTYLPLALAAPALAVMVGGACGKDDNDHPPSVVEFPHAFPEAPRALSTNLAPAWTSGRGIAASAEWLYVTDRDNKALVRMHRQTLEVERTLSLGARPEQVIVAPDGAALVTVRGSGEVIRLVDMTITQRVDLGVETHGIALSSDGQTAYVTVPSANELAILDASTLEELDRVETLDMPRGVAVSDAGIMGPPHVTVAHEHLEAVQFGIDSDGLIDDLQQFPVTLRRGNPADLFTQSRLHGLKSTRALAVVTNPENGTVYTAHVVASPGTETDFMNSEVAPSPDGGVVPDDGGGGGYGSTAVPGAVVSLPTRPVEVSVTGSVFGGGTFLESELPVKDPATGENMLALVDQPSDLAHHPTHTLLFMVGYGTDNVLVMSTSESDPMRSPVGVISVGRAPRAITFSPDGKLAYVLNEHELTVSEIDLAPFLNMKSFPNPGRIDGSSGANAAPTQAGSAAFFEGDAAAPRDGSFFVGGDPSFDSPRVDPIRVTSSKAKAYGIDPFTPEMRRGARVYTFARNENMSHGGQFACASCHLEGREDKLVWFIPDGPRQTPALSGRLLGTAPFNWNGTKDGLQDNMVQTVERMGGKGLTKQELADLEQFLLHGLEAPANPYLAKNGELTMQQEWGRQIFNSKEAGCGTCHRPDQNFTDGFTHDVGTVNQLEVARFEVERAIDPNTPPPGRLNTPTLKGLYYTAPYLHDGSAADLMEVLKRTATTMGRTDHLTLEEKEALVAYLKTL